MIFTKMKFPRHKYGKGNFTIKIESTHLFNYKLSGLFEAVYIHLVEINSFG